jgi:hypothetical protein
MRTVLLDDEAFQRTFVSPMRDVTANAEPLVDVWPYISAIPTADLGPVAYRIGEVDYVYRSGDDRFDHILVAAMVQHLYLVIVVARDTQTILGHHLLDLDEKYGLGAAIDSPLSRQAGAICAAQGVAPEPPVQPKLGIAVATLHLDPLNGLRVTPEGETCGWYVWGGDLSAADDFFQPMHVAHIPDHCARIIPYLSLPPGYRFLLGENGYEDVWHDAELLKLEPAD